jgi:TRAP-type C4-dicarboxylate transport system permease small subunit
MNILKYIDKIILKIEHWLVIISLTLMVIFTSMNVIFRALYTHAHMQWANNILSRVDWSEPFARLLVLWVAFLGASLLTKENRHIRIEIPGIMTSPLWSAVRELLLSLGCVVICLFMVKNSVDYLLMEMKYGSSTFMGAPAWVYQLIIPAGFSIMLFRFLINGLENLLILSRGRSQ